MLISFIIPVYNRASLLSETIDSVLSSEFQNYEIILVNNASTDESGAVCDYYSAKYPFISTIHLYKNVGAGGARNVGIDVARGEWLFFLDSDDLIYGQNLPQIAQKLAALPNVVEMVAIETSEEYQGVRWEYNLLSKDISVTVSQYLDMYPYLMCTPVWCYFVRRQYVLTSEIRFMLTTLTEDDIFMLDLFLRASHISVINEFMYCYRIGIACNSIISQSKSAPDLHLSKCKCLLSRLCNEYMMAIERDICVAAAIRMAIERYTIPYALNLATLNPDYLSKNTVELSLTPDFLEAVDYLPFCSQIFYFVIGQFQDKQCYLAPAGQANRKLADYLIATGHEVLGFFDNGTSDGWTPDGHNLPVYPREMAKEVCGKAPILVTPSTITGAKLKKYYQNCGLTALLLCTKDLQDYYTNYGGDTSE